MWGAIAAVLQILYLVLKNSFEKDAEEKKRKQILYEDAKKAIVSRNASAITSALDGLRESS